MYTKIFFKLFLILLLFGFQKAEADTGYRVLKEFNIRGLQAVDPMGNIFYAENGIIKKMNSETNQKYSFFKPSLGFCEFVDASDPLNVLAWFPATSHIVFLNARLTSRRVFNLTELYPDDFPSWVAAASSGGFWTLFEVSNTLVRFDSDGRIQIQTVVTDIRRPQSSVVSFVEHSEKLYWQTEKTVKVYDEFGNFLKEYDFIASLIPIALWGNQLFYVQGKQLRVYDFFLEKESVILLPGWQVSGIAVSPKNIVYIQTDSKLKTIRIDL